ncbi:type VI secretion protein, partial [Escherichia coli]|nr:type VI secretion protein [Escherichia coli]
MVGAMSSASESIKSREFVKITIDGKIIKGNSKVDQCTDYFDGNCPQAFHAFASIDGTVFDLVNIKLKVTKEIQLLLEHFFKRGEKDIVIEIVRRESTKSGSAYSSFKVIYNGCRLHDLLLSHDYDTNLCLEMSFSPEESVSLEMNLPSADGKSTEKLGP